MKLSNKNFQNLAESLDVQIEPFFSPEEIEKLARDSNFVQRKGKINGQIFLDLIVFNRESLKDESLNDLSIKVDHKFGIDIEKQSLHDRFNKYALAFLSMALEELLKNQLPSESILKNIKGFNRILIKDSVCFQIDESLVKYYKGSGGSGSKAAMRIQLEYDILNGKINDLSINAFNDQDASDSIATIEKTEKGDLIIRDLAYMSLEVLKKVAKKLAFFLCRLNTNVNVYEIKDEKYVKLNFKKIANHMKKREMSVMEKEVYLGHKDKFKVRLMIYLMPEEEYAKRIRNAKKNNKKKGRGNLSDEFKARASLNLFITNTSSEQIPKENAWSLYRLRWQIELMFKVWKSICCIDKVKKVKKHRLECYVLSKLIFIVLGWQILWKIASQMFVHAGKAMSYYKAFKTLLRTKLEQLRQVIMFDMQSINNFMVKFYNISIKNHLLEKKKDLPTSLELLITCIAE